MSCHRGYSSNDELVETKIFSFFFPRCFGSFVLLAVFFDCRLIVDDLTKWKWCQMNGAVNVVNTTHFFFFFTNITTIPYIYLYSQYVTPSLVCFEIWIQIVCPEIFHPVFFNFLSLLYIYIIIICLFFVSHHHFCIPSNLMIIFGCCWP